MATKSVKSKDLSRLIRPQVRKLEAYSIDETPCRVKLDAMESPFPMPDNVRQEIAEAVKSAPINRYPDPSAKKLKQAIAGMWGIEPAQTILGNGSDELIQAVILAFGGPVLVPAPTFSMYEITSRALAQDVVAVSLTKDFSLDADKMIGKAKQVKARVIFLASPNNPTGNRFSDEAIMKILDKTNAAVVIDEAYFSFSGKTYLRRMKDHPNMIILRTLSKIGLAGLRIGALTASPGVIAELNKVRLPYNINALSQAAALVVLGHWNTLYEQISLLISERERLYNALSSMRGVAAYPSETNFILFRTDRDASRVHAKLKQAGILIKDLNRPGPLKNCLRVTVGAPIENNEFLGALRGIVKS
ncbi:MAG TPA: histidinol-phosphate transaminase [Nitrospirota bacterium]